jgi:hypothetical protein
MDAVETWLLGLTRVRSEAELRTFRNVAADLERRVASQLMSIERALEMRAATMRALERRLADLEKRAVAFGPPEPESVDEQAQED